MFILYCFMILLGVYVASSKKMEGGVKAFIIIAEVVILVISVASEILGG